MTKRFLALLLGAALAQSLWAQSSEADRKLFAQLKARADKGDAEAQLNLGSLYANGTGAKRDPVKAAKWHHKAADQGLARAQYQVGLDYENGLGVKPDPEAAVDWFQKAAEQGLLEAELELGLCYASGEGASENGAEAVRWFRKAAEQGSAYAKYEMGKCYFEGKGLPKDIAEGFKWTRAAAETGFALAQNALGACYEKGTGVTKDLMEAYKWYALAAAQDDEHAADIRVSLAKLEAVLTPEQVTLAQIAAREFKPARPGAQPLPADGQVPQPPPGSNTKTTGTGAEAPAAGNAAQNGLVNVTAADGGCDILLDGAFVGNPPARLRLGAGRHVIEVKKAGFKTFHKELQVDAGSELTLRAVLERE